MQFLLLALAFQLNGTMSDLMVKIIYPTSDSIFYITTRTPGTEAEWAALQKNTEALEQAARELIEPRRARDRERWLADAQLMVDASVKAVAAVKARDLKGLEDLNDALYTSCVQCHQHYRPNYGRRSLPADRGPERPAPPGGNDVAVLSGGASASGGPSASDGAAVSGPRDIEAVWNFSTLTPFERPQEFSGKPYMTDAEAAAFEARTIEQGNRDRRGASPEADVGGAYNEFWFDRGLRLATIKGRHPSSLVVDPPDGRVPPLTAAAQQHAAARAAERRQHPTDGPEDRPLGERCLMFNAGPPMNPGPYNNYVQIFQNADRVIIFNEMIHDARVVPLDGSPHPPASIRRWQGDSRGRWDGQTLVVDTTNFSDKTNFRGADQNLHLVERFTRIDAKTLLYEYTVDDPTAFMRSWTVSLPMTKTDDRVFEYACHEGNYALENILRGARTQEKQNR
jgi:hypothetical protein